MIEIYFIAAKPERNVLEEISKAFKVHSFEFGLHLCQRTLLLEDLKLEMILPSMIV
jgi:hypothetical protein